MKTTRSFEVTTDLRRVAPMRTKGITSWEGTFMRDDPPDLSTPFSAAIEGDTLQLSFTPPSCHETAAGCGVLSPTQQPLSRGHRDSPRPATVLLEEKVLDGACISYAVWFGTGMAVGVGTEMRTYSFRNDGGVDAGPRVTTPVLDIVSRVPDGVLLQEAGGDLWLASAASTPPTVTRVSTIKERIRAISTPRSGWYYVYTDRAMYAVDMKTFDVLWKVDGEVWAATSDNGPLRHYVLTVERDTTPRAVLRLLDAAGKRLREIVVYKGDDLHEARLERVRLQPKPDHDLSLFHVSIATR